MKDPAKKTAHTARSRRQGILVLGMHRSGTSALTRVLNLLGCALPANLIGPGDGNVLGHWEAFDAVTLNDEILASAGSSWEDWGPINEEWRQSGIRSEMLDRIGELVAQHAALGPLFALKDPRICRLADLWLEAMDGAGVEPLAVLMVRNPLEVVRSLESRDLMVPAYGQLLWLRHVLDAEFASRGRKRVVCRYDQMMRNWPGMVARIRSSLGVALPRNSPAVRAEVDAFLTSEQRHQQVDLDIALEDPWLSNWVRTTLSILVRWSEQGEDPADFAELDDIRHQFNNAYGALAAVFINNEIVGSVGLGSRMKAQLDQEIELARRAGEEAQVRAQQAEALEVELARLQSETERLAQEAAELSPLNARVAELQGLVEAERGRATGLEEQLQALAGIEQKLQAEIVQKAELSGRLNLAESTLIQRQEELVQLWEQLRAAGEEAGASRAELAQERKRRLDVEERFKALDVQSQETEQKLAARFDEIARLTRLLVDEGQRVSQAASDAEWLRSMNQVAENFPKWWVILPKSWRRRREHSRYRRAGLFDAEGYLDLYPDVGEDGMDPVRHYILHGMVEGRTRTA